MRKKISALGVKKYLTAITTMTFLMFAVMVSAQENSDDFVLPDGASLEEDQAVDNGPSLPEGDKEMSAEELDKLIESGSIEDWGASKESSTGVDCFDYYTFPSVQTSFGLEKSEYTQGEPIIFLGEMANENKYPVVDGTVFVRISRKNDGNYMKEGYDIVDEFVALEGVSIDGNNIKEGVFEWMVPINLAGGDYVVDYFFSVGNKFNLGGLPFSNEIVSGKSFFNVVGESGSYISFDRTSTKVDGNEYVHIGNWPIVDAGNEVRISQSLSNTFNENKEVNINYELYYWDSLNKKDLINSKNEVVNVPANGNLALDYIIPRVNEAVYYLKIVAVSGSQKSIVNIRLGSMQERPRLNYPAITKFPLKKGDDFTLFSCFHNTSGANTEGKVVAFLSDKSGEKIGNLEHNGIITSAMSANKADIKAKKDYNYLKLNAEVYNKDGNLVDEYEVIYDCEEIGNCEIKKGNVKEAAGRIFSGRSVLIIIFSIIVIATVVVVIMEKRKR